MGTLFRPLRHTQHFQTTMTVHYIYNPDGTVTTKEIPDEDVPNAAADELDAILGGGDELDLEQLLAEIDLCAADDDIEPEDTVFELVPRQKRALPVRQPDHVPAASPTTSCRFGKGCFKYGCK